MQRIYKYVLVSLVLGLALAGCGQKGALYLPDAPASEQTGVDSPSEASDEQTDPSGSGY